MDVEVVRQLVDWHPGRRGDRDRRGVELWRVDVSGRDDRCVRVDDRSQRWMSRHDRSPHMSLTSVKVAAARGAWQVSAALGGADP